MPHHGQQPQLGEHGADLHTDVTREVFLPANEGFVVSGTADRHGNLPTVNGGANLAQPDVCLAMQVPEDFVSFNSVRAIWMAEAAGNMRWKITASYCADGEDRDTHLDSPLDGETASGGANIKNVQEPANPLTLASLALGDTLALRFIRAGAHANDTLDATMHFIGFLFSYEASQ